MNSIVCRMGTLRAGTADSSESLPDPSRAGAADTSMNINPMALERDLLVFVWFWSYQLQVEDRMECH